MSEGELRPSLATAIIDHDVTSGPLPMSGNVFSSIEVSTSRNYANPAIPRVIPGSEIGIYYEAAREFGIGFTVKRRYVSENPLSDTKPHVFVEYGPFPHGVYSGFFEKTVDGRRPLVTIYK